ncbi:MAG: DUF1015 domain-containing protein [Desulfobulbaceae bacterium]|uniref:DUF1015 domain-containing protein n=1 Tax=Candidatus Desulfatifera sulfidica TaxID=2841691 RepID=A0A8J6TEI5_9BACT|nr:DUF1015 domain-containing protein [Candidatus Desulfatifera sulfidica]
MAFIAPFRGVCFNPEKVGRLDDVMTPPYDVINDNLIAAYLEKNPYNMIRLDITKSAQSAEDSDARYQGAAALFQEWLDNDILKRDSQPAIYLYETEYNHPSGKTLTRKGFVCLVGLAEFAEGVVKPHERTFETVIADRLKLMETCKAQFSQIFSVYSDPENEVMSRLEQVRGEALGSVLDADGCRHSLWRVSDADTISAAQRFFLDKSVYIADGHHRYTTSLAHRRNVTAVTGNLDPRDPANHIMMYLCPMEDCGLSVLPTHRLVNWPGKMMVADLLRCIEPYVDVEEMQNGSRESLIGEVMSRMNELENQTLEKSSSTFGLYHAGEDRCFLLTMKSAARSSLADRPEVLKDLDVVILSDLLIEKALDLNHHRCELENLVRYFSDADEALDVAVKDATDGEEQTPLLFVMNPTRVSQVQDVADQGLVMPHKSTYFYPKVMTGLLFHQLKDGETIDRLD